MKIKIEIVDDLDDVEVIIRSSKYDDIIESLKRTITQHNIRTKEIIFYKNGVEYFFPLENILFFEMESNLVYAHDIDNCYVVNFKLYELEEITPSYFVRISKSSIINVKEIYSLEKSFSGTSTAEFRNSVKKVHISRKYYKELKYKLKEVR